MLTVELEVGLSVELDVLEDTALEVESVLELVEAVLVLEEDPVVEAVLVEIELVVEGVLKLVEAELVLEVVKLDVDEPVVEDVGPVLADEEEDPDVVESVETKFVVDGELELVDADDELKEEEPAVVESVLDLVEAVLVLAEDPVVERVLEVVDLRLRALSESLRR